MTEKKRGCGEPATRICFRGATKRLWLCDDCKYEGGGRVMPYATHVAGKEPPKGAHSGPAKRCGEEVLE